ncbi:Outer membrane protein transport protein (OMPP1/FadL/TodX) [Pseudovibrio axinellae]|uniref:Outer membrane protein transport protein (OMPP1/FadL/TodX) n=1 Tax=Pseudovibrio axinellae TaxID=989403 RepID=A0A161V987_9HYPH|nr:outer membrane protein transport protein [Pseudovibrio axinellae]KZL21579.1 Outer membrane protein transport protein (OMPP1/FadL/TodX) [Pseudovibrio axinellae]SER10342.1 long-chain fatty acid transport protein [Pseudovibrio axinellae]
MRVLKLMARTTVLGCAVSMIPAAAFAGGWSTEGIASYDLLFAEERFGFEFQSTYGFRNVDFKNASTTQSSIFGSYPLPGEDGADDIAADLWIGSAAVKMGLTDNLDFFARVSEPFEVREAPGFDWNGQYAIGETIGDTLSVEGMLSYRHEVSDGRFFRVFGGVRTMQMDFSQQAALYGTLAAPTLATSSDLAFGYRIGAAFEVPEIALRALVSYESAVDLDMEGALTDQGFLFTNAVAETTLPQSFEVKVQSGVAPGWLVSLGVKWTDWSVMQEASANLIGGEGALIPVLDGSTTRDLSYSDGWIVEAGVGHQLTDKLALGSSVIWDKGIGGPYSDYYAFTLGGAYDLGEHVTLSLGGTAIYKTADEGNYNVAIDLGGGPSVTNTDYEYDSSWNFALSSKLRFTF